MCSTASMREKFYYITNYRQILEKKKKKTKRKKQIKLDNEIQCYYERNMYHQEKQIGKLK